MNMKIKIFTTGGTIDKIYFDQKSEYQVGDPQAKGVLEKANVVVDYEVESILKKRPDLPVLLCSGYTGEKSQWEAIQSKGYHYLQKPYSVIDLLKTIKMIVDIPK